MKPHVGVDIDNAPILFKQATKTTGRDREISLESADTQLLTDLVRDHTHIRTEFIESGSFGTVVERYVNSNGTTELASLIKSTNASTIPSTNPNCPFATKIIATKRNNLIESTTLREFVLRNLDDPGVVKIGAANFHHNPVVVDPIERSTYIAMDRAKSSLAGLIHSAAVERSDLAKEKGRSPKLYPLFAVNEYKMLTYQLIRAVAYLHSERIIHADIKPGNTLVSAIKDVPKECLDFVLANRSKPMQTFKMIQLTDFGMVYVNYIDQLKATRPAYTIGFRPPEFLFGKVGKFWDKAVDRDYEQYITPKSDIWALGCVLYKMATGDDFTGSSYTCYTLEQTNARLAYQMWANFDTAPFEAIKSILPGYNTQRMTKLMADCPTTCTNSWNNKALARYPGLKPLLLKMLVVDPMKRIDAFELMQDSFFVSDGVGRLFGMVTNTLDKFTNIPYYPDSLVIQTPYVLRHMMKSLPSEYDSKHTSSTKFNQTAYRRIACQISKTMTALCTTQTYTLRENLHYSVESKVMTLAHIWALKNPDNSLDSYSSSQLEIMILALISIALKTLNYSEISVVTMIGYNDKNCQMITAMEYELLRELDCDLLASTPYDFIDMIFNQVQREQPQFAKLLVNAERAAKNLLRVVYYNPAMISKIETIQLIDSILDICVRSKINTASLYLYKSFDPHYSQLKLANATALQFIKTIMSDQNHAGLGSTDTQEITNAIVAYSQSNSTQ